MGGYEIFVDAFTGKFICDSVIMNRLLVNKKYKFTYVKKYSGIKYRLLSAELIDEIKPSEKS